MDTVVDFVRDKLSHEMLRHKLNVLLLDAIVDGFLKHFLEWDIG
jgi:hypothetical protein